MHVIAAKAVAFLEALQREFKDYQKQVVAGARATAVRLPKRNYKIVSGGTDNHLFLLDLSDKAINGEEERTPRSVRRTSPSTRMQCPTTRARRWLPAVSASARPLAPHAASRNANSNRSRIW